MADRRYRYRRHETGLEREGIDDLEAVINEYAREGWRLHETVERDGTTIGLLFERES